MKIRKGTYFALSLLLIICMSNIGMIAQVSAYSDAYHNQMEIIAQQEDELENLDKRLKVTIAVSLELDKDDPVQVVTSGIRVGKAVLVDPLSVEISLSDLDGFELGVRKFEVGDTSSDYQSKAIEIYPKIFMTEFPALQIAGNYLVTADITYRAPWGEIITGRGEQQISVQEWFNISSILIESRDTTKLAINSTLGGIADIGDAVAGRIANFSGWIGDQAEVLWTGFRFGKVADPSALKFFPIYFPSYDNSYFTSTGIHKGADGMDIKPDDYMQDFIDSLKVLVDNGIPFNVYPITDMDEFLAFTSPYNSSDTLVTNENPLGGASTTAYLSFDPEDPNNNDPTKWTSDGYDDGTGNQYKDININDPDEVTYQNVVVNMYDRWFPIATSWTDYTKYGSELVSETNFNRNGTRWIKQIAMGLRRNSTLLYNVNGKIFDAFFVADGSPHGTYDIPDVYSEDGNNREGLTILNDWTLMNYNKTNDDLNLTGEDLNLETRKYFGENFVQIQPISHHQIESATRTYTETFEFIGPFFNKTYPELMSVTKDGYALRMDEITHSGYNIGPKYACAVGARCCPAVSFAYTSLEDTKTGFEILHGMYYKVLFDQVILMEDKLGQMAEEIKYENYTEYLYYKDLSNNIHDAWYGTEAEDYKDNLDLDELNVLFQEYTIYAFNKSIPWLVNRTVEISNNASDEIDNADSYAVEVDQALEQAGSDISFGFGANLGALIGGIGGAIFGGLLGVASSTGPAGIVAGALIGGGIGASIGGWIGGGIETLVTPPGKSEIMAILANLLGDVYSDIRGAITDLVKGINAIIQQINQAITDVLAIVQDLANQVSNIIAGLAQSIRDLSQDLQDIVDWAYAELITQTENLLANLENIKNEVARSIGFYIQVQNGFYKLLEQSEFAAGLLRYASLEFGDLGVTEEIFFKEVDVLKPLTLAESGDSGFYITQLGTEGIDELYYVTMYKGQMVSAEPDIWAQFSSYATIRNISITEASGVNGLYIADFSLAGEGDWMTKVEANYDTGSEIIEGTSVDRTTKIIPSLQPDAYPAVLFDPSAVTLRTGENYLMNIGIDNLMYSAPNVTVRAELVSPLGLLVGLREAVIQLNPEGENAENINLEANLPFYVPAGDYDLVIKIIEDNGDVTRRSYKVIVIAENFIFGIIGAILSFLGLGLVIAKTRQKQRSKKDILLARSDGFPYSKISKKKIRKCAPNDWECLLN